MQRHTKQGEFGVKGPLDLESLLGSCLSRSILSKSYCQPLLRPLLLGSHFCMSRLGRHHQLAVPAGDVGHVAKPTVLREGDPHLTASSDAAMLPAKRAGSAGEAGSEQTCGARRIAEGCNQPQAVDEPIAGGLQGVDGQEGAHVKGCSWQDSWAARTNRYNMM